MSLQVIPLSSLPKPNGRGSLPWTPRETPSKTLPCGGDTEFTTISSIRSYGENYRVCEHERYRGACLITNARDFNNLRGVREGLEWWDPFDWNDRISSLERR